MEEKLNSILNNPQLMQQIMSMAQTLGNSEGSKENPQPPHLPNLDPKLLRQIASFANQSETSQQEQALLNALAPFLCADRISKLEKAMRAAKMAKFASGFFNAGGLPLLTGR